MDKKTTFKVVLCVVLSILLVISVVTLVVDIIKCSTEEEKEVTLTIISERDEYEYTFTDKTIVTTLDEYLDDLGIADLDKENGKVVIVSVYDLCQDVYLGYVWNVYKKGSSDILSADRAQIEDGCYYYLVLENEDNSFVPQN